MFSIKTGCNGQRIWVWCRGSLIVKINRMNWVETYLTHRNSRISQSHALYPLL